MIPAAGLALWAGGLVAAQSIAAVAALRARRSSWSAGVSSRAALLLRPCAGDEPALEENLMSVLRARWGGPVRVRLGVARADDPALGVCERVAIALRHKGIDATVVITGATAANQKAAQLAALLEREPDAGGAVVVADSDVDLTGLPLGAALQRLEAQPRLAAVWVPPVERGASTDGDRASRALLGTSLHAFSLLARIDPAGLVGKLFVARTDALREVGGFDALTRHLGEDMELSRRWRAAGWRIEAAPFTAPSSASGRTWGAVTDRYARWVTVIRGQRPALLPSYPLLFFATVPWSAGAAALCVAQPSLAAPAIALGACVWGARLGVAAAGARCAEVPWTLGDVLRADALLALSFARAMRSREFTWRGRALTLRPDGTLGAAEA